MLSQMARCHYFLWLSSILTCMFRYHIFLIHSSTDGHLGCLHILAIINKSAMSIRAHISFLISVFVFSG